MNIMFVKVDPNQKGPKAAKIFHFYKHENHLLKMEYKFSKVILINGKVLMKQSRLVKKENLTGNHFRNHSFNFIKIEYESEENGFKFERFDKLKQKHLNICQFSFQRSLSYLTNRLRAAVLNAFVLSLKLSHTYSVIF